MQTTPQSRERCHTKDCKRSCLLFSRTAKRAASLECLRGNHKDRKRPAADSRTISHPVLYNGARWETVRPRHSQSRHGVKLPVTRAAGAGRSARFMDQDLAFARMRAMQRLALALLVVAAVAFVLARTYEPLHPGVGYLRAFCEAALVGGLADWFAVTALFRRPLGLPIPHTAIIPEKKDRLGQALGEFVERNFL